MAERAGVVQIDVEPGLQGLSSKIDAGMRALKPFGFKAQLDSTLARDLDRQTKAGQRSLDSITTNRAQGELRTLGSTADQELGRIGSRGKVSSQALLTIGAGATIAGAKVVSSLAPAVEKASDLNEAVSYSTVVFGDSAAEIESWAETADKAIGQSKRQAVEGATTFATFGKSAGLAGDELVEFSTDLVQLASDMASAKNTTPEGAITAIGAALRGESEPIRQYGVLLDDMTLRNEALALGLIKTTKEALTPQQKVLAAQAAIFKQTGDQQGDFARTSDGLANSQRIAAAEFENAQAKLGEGLVPVLATVTKVAGGALEVLDKIPGATSALGLGIAGVGGAAILGGTVTSLLGARKALKEYRDERALLSSGTDATVAPVDTAETAAAATATETVARAMDDVTASSTRAGAAGTAAMGSITAGATTATAAIGAAAGSMSVMTAIDLTGPATQVTRLRSEVVGIGSAMQGLPAGRGAFIDVDSWEVLGELGPGAVSTVESMAPAATRTAGPLSRLGTAVKGVGTNLRSSISSIPPFTAALAAGTVAVAGFGYAWSELKRQTQEGVDGFAIDTDTIVAAFDPEKPNRYGAAVEEVARALAEMDAVGEFDALDRLDTEGDDAEDRANVARQVTENLSAALDQLSTKQGREFLADLTPRLEYYGLTASEAADITAELYGELDDRDSVARATGSFVEAAEKLDRFGYAADQARGKYGQMVDEANNALNPFQAAIDAGEEQADLQSEIADAEAEVARLRAESIPGTEAATRAANDLAQSEARVAESKRSVAAAQRDLNDANRDLADLEAELAHVDPNRDPNRYRELSEKVRDAQDAQLDAQDRAASAAESQRSAEADLGETRSDGASKTDELAEAEKRLADLRERELAAAQAFADAMGALNDEVLAHPELLEGAFDTIDQWVAKGWMSKEAADAWKKAALELYATLQLPPPRSEYLTGDGVDHEHAAGRTTLPTLPPAFTGPEVVGPTGGFGYNAGGTYYPWGRLSGGPVSPRSMYAVTEDGRPELLEMGGETYLMTGDQSGRVVSNPQMQQRATAGAAVGGESAIVAELRAMRADIANLQNVTFAPIINARPDQVERSMAESFRASRTESWTEYGRDLAHA